MAAFMKEGLGECSVDIALLRIPGKKESRSGIPPRLEVVIQR